MATLDLSPLYRSSIGFDRVASLLDASLRGEANVAGFPAYNIEVLDENRYEITLAVPGYGRDDLDIQVEKGLLTIRGGKREENGERHYLHRGIAIGGFERKFNLADHVEVVDAQLNNGLLKVDLVREIPEAMKPKSIPIQTGNSVLEHKNEEKAENSEAA